MLPPLYHLYQYIKKQVGHGVDELIVERRLCVLSLATLCRGLGHVKKLDMSYGNELVNDNPPTSSSEPIHSVSDSSYQHLTTLIHKLFFQYRLIMY